PELATEDEPPPAPASVTPAADPWSALLQAGMALLSQVAGARNDPATAPASTASPGGVAPSLVKRDEKTGETYLKLPVPAPEVLDQALRAVSNLLESLRK